MVNNFLNTLSTEETNAIKFVLNEMFSFYLKNPSGKFEIYSLMKKEGFDSDRIIEILNEEQLIRNGGYLNAADQYDKKYEARIAWKGIAEINQEFIDTLMNKYFLIKKTKKYVYLYDVLNDFTENREIIKDYAEYLNSIDEEGFNY